MCVPMLHDARVGHAGIDRLSTGAETDDAGAAAVYSSFRCSRQRETRAIH